MYRGILEVNDEALSYLGWFFIIFNISVLTHSCGLNSKDIVRYHAGSIVHTALSLGLSTTGLQLNIAWIREQHLLVLSKSDLEIILGILRQSIGYGLFLWAARWSKQDIPGYVVLLYIILSQVLSSLASKSLTLPSPKQSTLKPKTPPIVPRETLWVPLPNLNPPGVSLSQ